DVVADIGPDEAVRAAYRHIRNGSDDACHTPHEPRFETTRYRPRVVAAFPMVNRPTILSEGPFDEPVQTNLVVFSDTRELAGLVSMVMKGAADFTIVIAASSKGAGRVLYCAAEAASVRGNVYRFNPDEEAATAIDFPRPPGDYPAGIRPAAPFRDWCDS